MRTMWDGITAGNLPTNAQLVAGYLTGRYAWSAADWARFPNSVHVGICTQAQYDIGVVLDVETGDATPAQAPGWVTARRVAGVDPTVYCNASTWPTVRAAFQSAGVVEPWYWIAEYDHLSAIPAGAVAKQYENTPGYDLSSVTDYWPGVDPAMTFNYSDPIKVPPFGPNDVRAIGDVVNDMHIWSGQAAAAIPELDSRLVALQSKVDSISVSGVDLVALAKAVCDEQDRRAAKRDGTVV